MSWQRALAIVGSLLVPLEVGAEPPESARPNGFDLSHIVVDLAAIRPGGPKRDRIRSVDTPEFVPAEKAPWSPPTVPVIGVALEGAAQAHPVHLLEHHQVVNTEVGGVPLVVSYDPLTGIPMAYRRTLDGKVLRFGVSGLIYNAQFLLYDRETESLWAQYEGRAVSGPLAGKQLERVVVRQELMGIWFQRHPETQVLARPERMRIDYRYSPYAEYWVSEKVPLEVRARDDRYHPKEVVLGIQLAGKARAYLGSILTSAGGRIVDDFEGQKIRVVYDTNSSTFQWDIPDSVRVTEAYWFAWKSLHPETEIWREARSDSPEQ